MGLLEALGGQAWFDFIQRTVHQAPRGSTDIWLYDEDPFPSGTVEASITMEHPEYRAIAIRRIVPAERRSARTHCFAPGTLLSVSMGERTRPGRPCDLNGLRVGRAAQVDQGTRCPWDSRNYYPATPFYPGVCAWTKDPEYAVEAGEAPQGFTPLAFVAQPVGSDHWPDEPDRLNVEATRLFLEADPRCYVVVGDRFGKQIKAIFSDEPKYDGTFPWSVRDVRGVQAAVRLRPAAPAVAIVCSDDRSAIDVDPAARPGSGAANGSAARGSIRSASGARTTGWRWWGTSAPRMIPYSRTNASSNLFPAFRSFAVPGFDLIHSRRRRPQKPID